MRIPTLRNLALALVVASLFCSASASPALAQTIPQQVDRVTTSVNAGSFSALSGHVPAWVKTAPDLGQVPATAPVDLNIVLARAPEVQSAIDQLVLDQQNPKSAMYHHWLTPQEVGTLYGPTQHDLDAVTAWLTSSGFQVKNVAANRIMIEVSAPAQVVESAFHVALHTFQIRNMGALDKVQAPLSEPSVPGALQSVIASIGGLSNVPMHVHSRYATAPMAATNIKPQGTAVSGAGTAGEISPAYTLSSGSLHLLAPADFATIYDLNSVYSAGTKGAGQAVMIIGGVRLNATDVSTWETLSALPAYQPNYKLGPNFTDPGYASSTNDDGEETLDFERVYGTAPAATVDEVIAANWLSGTVNYSLQSYAINTVADPIMTMSFSSCEADQSPAYLAQENTLYQQAAMQGISVFASSGDSGADTCENHGAAAVANQTASISDICASPYVTCVGGTEFNDTTNTASYWSSTNGTGELSALSYIPEGAWNEPTSVTNGVTSYVVAATGGGFSTSQTKPSFQTGTGVPADGHRDVPDLSFSASAHNGYFSCLTSAGASCTGTNPQLVYFSGTSATAPSMAGIAALIDERVGAKQGSLNTLLYKTATTSAATFNDATPTSSGVGSACTTATPSMCNNSDPSPTALTGGLAGYPLTVGYDESTGLGSMDVAKFLSVAALPAPSGTVTANPTTITVSQTATFSVTLTGSGTTPTGTVQFTSNGVNIGSAITLVAGSATSAAQSFPAAATYAINAVYSGDSNYSAGSFGPLQFVVTNPSGVASTSTLTATATTLTPAQTVTFTDTITGASGTPTGTVQFLVDGFNQGAAVSLNGSGVATLGPTTLPVGTHAITAKYTGDTHYLASTSNSVGVTVTALSSSTSIAISATTTTANGYLIFTGNVTGVAGGPVPTGTLDLYYNGSSVLQSPIALSNGAVDIALTFSGSGITPGNYPVMWVYSGDTNYLGSQSALATFTISSSFTPTYTLTPGKTTVSTSAGTAATNTITVASTNGFSNNTSLSCTAAYSGSSSDTIVEPTCSFSPATINLLNDSAANVNTTSLYETSTVTLTTVVPHGKERASNQISSPFKLFGGTALAGLLLFSIPGLRRRRSWNALACMIVLTAAGGMVACGGGGSTPAPSVTISVSPTSAALSQGQTQQFTATVGNTSNTAVTWSLNSGAAGSISSTGLYTAPASITSQQTVTITATSQADNSKTATATVTLMPPSSGVSVSVSPTTATLSQGQTQQFTATVANSTNSGVTWSLNSGAPGTITGSGLYTAPASITTQQTATVTATSQADPTKSASATITLTPPSTTLTGSPSGNYTITVTGTGGVTTTFTLTVQ